MIGSGFIGKVHSNAFRQVGHFFQLPYELNLKVICGRNRSKLEAAASQWGWEEAETDWRILINRKDIDIVDIAVPNSLHAPIAIAAAEAGKIVFCEKPLATSLEEAARIDGASDLRVFTNVILPLISPGLLTVALIVCLNVWNEFLISITFLQNAESATATA